MESLILLIPLSLLAVGVAVALFLRMNASGQFDDDRGPAWSVLMDDDGVHPDPPALDAHQEDAAAGPPFSDPSSPPSSDRKHHAMRRTRPGSEHR